MARGNSISNGNFTFTEMSIKGVVVVDLKCYEDKRGYFMETYKQPDFVAAGINAAFVQDNQSSSTKGVLRGLHFQIKHPQGKLVRVTKGEVFDVCVDLREGSSSYGKWEGVFLSEDNRRQLYIPKGFAHGFLVVSDYAEFCYKCDDIYHPGDESGIAWDDPDIGIEWPISKLGNGFNSEMIILSEKDKANPSFQQVKRLMERA